MIPRHAAAPALVSVSLLALAAALPALAQDVARPWLDAKLSPDERAALADQAMTPQERLSWLHGPMALPPPAGALAAAGYYPALPRLGLPAWQETDASLGVANPLDLRRGERSTALPSGLATAATFNPAVAYANGAMVGAEAWAKGFSMLLGGGVNLTREPRNGRNFEYLGEDPWLAGVLDGEAVRGTQSQHVLSTVKHYALNDQESLRHSINAVIDEAALRESDLLAFEIAIERGQPGSVMCSYNYLNGAPACGSDFLLNQVLKRDWRYPGFVMSDWGAVHSLDDAKAGLDQESGEQLDAHVYFKPLAEDVAAGRFPAARASDMSRRILRSLFAVGAIDHPAQRGAPIDFAAHAQVARQAEAEGAVLLKNTAGLLPLAASVHTILVVGNMADKGVLSGGGSAEVLNVGGPAATLPVSGEGEGSGFAKIVYHSGSPLDAIRAALPGVKVRFDNGQYPSRAAALAQSADLVVVVGEQWATEGDDAPDLSLPKGQDALISAVAAANGKTVVVLETGGPVVMPWLDQVGAVIEAWYPGQKGAEVIADILTGKINPSGRLPITFPASLAQLPRPELPGLLVPPKTKLDAVHNEGSDIGYRWFARTGAKPLFPFGYGLSYTSFAHENLTATGGKTLTVSFDVVNTGDRDGADAPQVYLTAGPGLSTLRLIGFDKVALKPGERRRVTLTADPRLLSAYDAKAHGWRLAGGTYQVKLATSAADPGQTASAKVSPQQLKP